MLILKFLNYAVMQITVSDAVLIYLQSYVSNLKISFINNI